MKMVTREYNFVTGPETPTLPTASTPIEPGDLVSKEYVDASFLPLDGSDEYVTKTGTETVTNKTLTSPVLTTPTVNVILATEQGSTPSNPSAGTRKIYVKTNGKAYLLDSAGLETELGSSGGGVGTVTSALTLAAAAQLTIDPAAGQETFLVGGSSTAIDMHAQPFGTTAPTLDGSLKILIGGDDTKTVTVAYSDASYGCIGSFSATTLARGDSVSFKWINSLSRYVLIAK